MRARFFPCWSGLDGLGWPVGKLGGGWRGSLGWGGCWFERRGGCRSDVGGGLRGGLGSATSEAAGEAAEDRRPPLTGISCRGCRWSRPLRAGTGICRRYRGGTGGCRSGVGASGRCWLGGGRFCRPGRTGRFRDRPGWRGGRGWRGGTCRFGAGLFSAGGLWLPALASPVGCSGIGAARRRRAGRPAWELSALAALGARPDGGVIRGLAARDGGGPVLGRGRILGCRGPGAAGRGCRCGGSGGEGGLAGLWPGAGGCATGSLPAVGRVRRDGGGRAIAATSPSPGRGLGRGWASLVGGLGCRRRVLVGGPGRARLPRGGVSFPRGRRGGTVPGRRRDGTARRGGRGGA